MEVTEEVVRRKQTLALDDPKRVYPEIRDLLERRMSFDEVSEEKYFHDVDTGIIRSKIVTTEFYDNKTREEIEIMLHISQESRELDIQLKAKLVTSYEEKGWKSSLWYYAYTALYEKFLYGEVRHEYVHSVEEKAEELIDRLKKCVEAM